MSKRIVLLATVVVAAAGLAVSAATASAKKHTSSHLLVGINDEAFTLYGDPTSAFATLKTLHTQALRVNLYWGGTKWAVAKSRPTDPTDPGDAAYDWTIYDRLVRYATQYNIKVLFSILFTPGWANGGKDRTTAARFRRSCGRRSRTSRSRSSATARRHAAFATQTTSSAGSWLSRRAVSTCR